MQKPHCRACSSANAFCNGCGSSSAPARSSSRRRWRTPSPRRRRTAARIPAPPGNVPTAHERPLARLLPHDRRPRSCEGPSKPAGRAIANVRSSSFHAMPRVRRRVEERGSEKSTCAAFFGPVAGSLPPGANGSPGVSDLPERRDLSPSRAAGASPPKRRRAVGPPEGPHEVGGIVVADPMADLLHC